MTGRRHPDWQSRFVKIWRATAARVHVWGEWDCSLGVCDVLQAIADIDDPAAPWRGRYKTEVGAYRALKAYLARNKAAFDTWATDAPPLTAIRADELLRWVAIIRARDLGWSPISIAHAGRGDPLVMRHRTAQGAPADFLGIVGLDHRCYVAAVNGWRPVARDQALGAWRLP